MPAPSPRPKPMTPLERMKTVLAHRQPDRVPLAELWIDPKVVQAIIPDAKWTEWNRLADTLDTDVVSVPTMVPEDHEVEWLDRENGVYRDFWGATVRRHGDAVPVPTAPRIESADDLRAYRPPDPAKSPVLEKLRRLKRKYPNGERAIVLVGESGWAPGVWLRGGLENVFLDMATDPGFIADVMKVGAEYYAELYRLAVPAGADIVLLGDDYSDKNGPMMSPRQFEEIILPCDAKVVAAAKKAGAGVIKHTDGNIWKIMDMLVGTGLDCLGPLEPVPGMDLDKILAHYPGRITVMGNISVDLLGRGTREDVVREVKRTLARVSAVGAHIMSSANTISSAVKPENYLALVETTKQYGTYPIDAKALLADIGEA